MTGLKLGPGALLMLWMAISMGLVMGAHVGYNATSAENVTMSYDADAGEFTAGNETVNIHDEPEEGNEYDESNSGIELSEDGERWLNGSFVNESAMKEPILPDVVNEPAEEFANQTVNATLDFTYSVAADSGQIAATYTYSYRDTLGWELIQLILVIVTLGPPVLIGYGSYKKVK